MIASATEKHRRVTAQSKLRMREHRSKTKLIIAKDIANVMQPDAMELDDVLVNNMMTTLVGAATPLKMDVGI